MRWQPNLILRLIIDFGYFPCSILSRQSIRHHVSTTFVYFADLQRTVKTVSKPKASDQNVIEFTNKKWMPCLVCSPKTQNIDQRTITFVHNRLNGCMMYSNLNVYLQWINRVTVRRNTGEFMQMWRGRISWLVTNNTLNVKSSHNAQGMTDDIISHVILNMAALL